MQAFNAAGKAPGVYMQEVDVPGPIPGVSTGIVAIVGPAQSGPINAPQFVTNWTQFIETFGGYIYDPPIYAAHAVRGFFENGGTTCCFVRAGVARCASLNIYDRSSADKPHAVFSVTSRTEGKSGEDIQISIEDAKLCDTTALKVTVTVEKITDCLKLTLSSAADTKKFLAGDIVCISQGSITEEAEVAIVSETKKEIILKYALVKSFSDAAASISLADLQGKKRVRLASVTGIEAGSYLNITQAAKDKDDIKAEEYAVVDGLDGNTILLRTALQEDFNLQADDKPIVVRSLEFTLKVSSNDSDEEYAKLSTVPYHSRYYEKIVSDSALVVIEPSDPPNPSPAPLNLPNPDYAPNNANLKDGKNDDPSGLTPEHYRNALTALEKVSINIVCVPDAVSFGASDSTVQKYAMEHCERMGDRFAVLDCGRGLSVQGVINQRADIGSSSYAAIYYPWIEIPHPAGQGRLKVPPSGHIAGVYARTDDQKGVHKAPGNEIIRGCLGVAALLNDTEHGMLNEESINAIVNIPGNGTTIMGARTLSNSTQWRYINVRRLLLYIEKSIQNATRFAVFLPNNPSLWATVKRQVSDFLHTVWRNGALFGTTPDQAFMVKIDEELNPPSVRALGQLIIEVVLYPVTPAEFVVFRVIQQPGGAEVSE